MVLITVHENDILLNIYSKFVIWPWININLIETFLKFDLNKITVSGVWCRSLFVVEKFLSVRKKF